MVDSGGGAATAAESMRSALAELNRKVPIVVFMNNVAASGGYLVSMPARHIVAQHGTITGSIGVISSKPSVGGLRDKLHLKGFEYARGENADNLSLTKPFSESQRAWMLKNVQESYEDFVAQVAHGRNMTPDAVDAVGGGRVWTGEQALEHGLVDSLGDLRHALDTLRQLAQVESSIPIALVEGKTQATRPTSGGACQPRQHARFHAPECAQFIERATPVDHALPCESQVIVIGGVAWWKFSPRHLCQAYSPAVTTYTFNAPTLSAGKSSRSCNTSGCASSPTSTETVYTWKGLGCDAARGCSFTYRTARAGSGCSRSMRCFKLVIPKESIMKHGRTDLPHALNDHLERTAITRGTRHGGAVHRQAERLGGVGWGDLGHPLIEGFWQATSLHREP
ncbi:MAG UNVERIFIED_CONTAM: S49 family peptidase [Anaerolineae bacterium]